MKYGIYDKDAQVISVLDRERVFYFSKIKEPRIGSIYRAYLGKRLDFLSANEVKLQESTALLFDKDRHSNGRGQILVQYKKHPFDDKQGTVSEKILLKGKYLILDPYSAYVNVSKKIKDENLRKDFIREFKDKKYGLIIRTAAREHMAEAKREYDELEKQMDNIFKAKDFKPCPKLIYQAKIDFPQIFSDLDKIYTNDSRLRHMVDGTDLIYSYDYSYLQDPNLIKAIGESDQKRISVNGAEIVIDELEALTVIDVNSAHIKSGTSKNSNAHYVNNLVLDKILSQIVLRNMGGILIIDFIRSSKKDMDTLMDIFKAKSDDYHIDIRGLSYTPSGLMEVIIKR